MIRKFFLLAGFTALSTAISANASELVDTWGSARAAGMGNAFTAVAGEGEALFYNPAALARVSGFHWTIIDPRVGVNGPQALEVAAVAGNSGTTADKLNDLFGKSVWVGGGSKTSFVVPNFGIAAYANGDVGVNLQNPAYPQLNLNYIFDYGIALGGAIDLIPSIWSVGLTARRVNRTGTNLPLGASVLATLNSDDILQGHLKDRGTGYGLDFGTMLTLPSPIRPTVAFTIRDLGYTTFSFDEGLSAPPRSEPDMTLGASITIDGLIASITPSIDYRYLDRPDIQTGKKLHLGLEFDLPLLSLRVGLNQGYYTAGVGLDMGIVAIDAATYGVELGEYPGQLEDRRYLVQLKIQLGLDGDFFSFSKLSGSAASSGRGKLKQRR
jgi:hypothetical protein